MSRGRRWFVLTGAGISAESGIPVFQGTTWHGRTHYELASIDAWKADPHLVWEYYSERRRRAQDAQPNAAHRALAEFARTLPAEDRFFLCTQNVDDLHEAAGSPEVVHIHGKLFESRCAQDCGIAAFADRELYSSATLPTCACGALLRPSVCWFGEQPYELDRIFNELEQCDRFLAVGTSGSVQPVASFVAMLKRQPRPVRTVYVGLEEPANAMWFDDVHLGPASRLLGGVLKKVADSNEHFR